MRLVAEKYEQIATDQHPFSVSDVSSRTMQKLPKTPIQGIREMESVNGTCATTTRIVSSNLLLRRMCLNNAVEGEVLLLQYAVVRRWSSVCCTNRQRLCKTPRIKPDTFRVGITNLLRESTRCDTVNLPARTFPTDWSGCVMKAFVATVESSRSHLVFVSRK